MAHVAEYKKRIVKDIVDLVNQYPIVGAVNMENLPAPQLQKMRAHLRDKLRFAMTKKRLMKIALEQAKDSKKGIEKLEEHFTGMPALIFTKENPFKLARMLKKNKSPAPAKAGQTAPKDIIVPAGPTSFAPGPIIGELGQIGIKAGVEGGKVAVKQDSVVAKKGDKIKPKVAEVLTRLGIEPMEVGLDLVATYEDGTVYTKDILDIDEDKFMADLKNAGNGAFNLAMFMAYPTKDTIEFLISKAFNDSKALGLSQDIIDEGIINELLAKAQGQMLGLSIAANIEVKAKPKEEAKPEKKEEPKEAKPEVKPEVKEEKPVEEPKKEVREEVKEEKKPEIKKEEVKEEKPVHIPKAEEKKQEEKELEEKKKAEEEKRKAEEAKKAEEERKKQEQLKKQEELRKKQEEEKRKREEQKRVEEEKKKQELKKRIEEDKRKAEELKKKVEEEKRKQEELKRQEEEKKKQELQKRAEELKKEEEIDIKVKEMVEKTKRMAKGPGPSAADILEDVKKEKPKKEIKEEKKKETKKEEPEKEEVKEEHPEAERLVKELQKKGTLRGVSKEKVEKKKPEVKEEKKEDEQKKSEELFDQLKKKGTLRDK